MCQKHFVGINYLATANPLCPYISQNGYNLKITFSTHDKDSEYLYGKQLWITVQLIHLKCVAAAGKLNLTAMHNTVLT